MIKRLHWAATIAALLLGVVHVAYTVWLHHALTLDALWFAGTGLATMAVALLNVTALRAGVWGSPRLVLAANLVILGFLVLLWAVIKEPQVMVGLVLFAALSGCVAWSLWPPGDRSAQS